MPFGFLNPLLLAGVLGAAVPVLVHLLGRRQATRRPFAALAFLLASERRLAARRRIRHLLLLLARATLIAAAAIALARPLLEGAIAAGSGQPVSAVVLLDASASMSARLADGESAFERARQRVKAELERLPSGSEALVIAAASGPGAGGQARNGKRLSPGFVSVSEALRLLDRAEVSYLRASLPTLAEEARASLEGARRAQHLVVVASDLQASSWPVAAGETSPGAPVLVIDVGVASDDVAITAATVAGAEERTVALDVARASGRPAGDVAIRLESAQGLVNRGVATLAEAAATVVLTIPDTVGHGAELTAVLEPGGSLAVNDRAYLWLPSPRRVRVLLADGAPHPNPWSDEIFYLERALGTEPRLSVQVVDASEGHLPSLDDFDVVLLADAARLDAASTRALSERVEAGVGLLFTVGGKTDPSTLQATLGRLLPVRPRGFQSRRAGEPPWQLTMADSSHAVLRPFDGSEAAETLRSAKISTVLAFEPAPDAHVILGLGDGPPALIEGRHGAGRVGVLATSVDREFADLAVRPAFVPLMTRLVLYLAGRVDDDRPRTFLVGEPVLLDAPLLTAPPRWDAPGGSEMASTEVAPGRYELATSERPGLYRAYIEGRREPELDYAVNVAPEESEFPRLSVEQASALFGGGSEGNAAAGPARESMAGVLWIMALAFAAEALLGRREGGTSAPGARE